MLYRFSNSYATSYAQTYYGGEYGVAPVAQQVFAAPAPRPFAAQVPQTAYSPPYVCEICSLGCDIEWSELC